MILLCKKGEEILKKLGIIRLKIMGRGYVRFKLNRENINLARYLYTEEFGTIPTSFQIDHIDGDKLNNRLDNLRLCTPSQNMCNLPPRKNKSSAYKGVYYSKRDSIYGVSITINNKRLHVGNFKTELEAARAYDEKAKELHGEFARLNFPDGQ